MKAHVEVVFTAGLNDLSQEEAVLIRSAVQLVTRLEPDLLKKHGFCQAEILLASRMLPELQREFRESNWQE